MLGKSFSDYLSEKDLPSTFLKFSIPMVGKFDKVSVISVDLIPIVHVGSEAGGCSEKPGSCGNRRQSYLFSIYKEQIIPGSRNVHR